MLSAYIVEKLFSSGWRRAGILFWTFADAKLDAEISLQEEHTKAVRILPVKVMCDSIWEKERE